MNVLEKTSKTKPDPTFMGKVMHLQSFGFGNEGDSNDWWTNSNCGPLFDQSEKFSKCL